MSDLSRNEPTESAAPERKLVRHRRRRRHSFRMETEADARRRDDYRALRFILPGALFLVGLLVLRFASAEPDPEMRPAPLLRIGCWFTGVGGVLLLLATLAYCVRKAREAAANARNDDDADDNGRHHHHHHHHHSHTGEN